MGNVEAGRVAMGTGWRGLDTSGLRAGRVTEELWPPRREDLLAAVGHLLDAEGWELLALARREDGLRLELRLANDPAAPPFTYEVGEARLRLLVHDARLRRTAQRARILLAVADSAADNSG
jgi:hypothetical protein